MHFLNVPLEMIFDSSWSFQIARLHKMSKVGNKILPHKIKNDSNFEFTNAVYAFASVYLYL